MARAQVVLRAAVVPDAPFLVDLWQASCRRVDRREQITDIEMLVTSAAATPEQRLLVAELDGEPSGAVFVKLSTLTPINPEPCVLVLSPTVLPGARRKGIGRMLLEAAVSFGEELGVSHIATAVDSGSRDGNRFMARVGLGPRATLRVAPLATVQAKVYSKTKASTVGSSPGRAPAGRQLGQILAARRSMRRPVVSPPAASGDPRPTSSP